MGKAKSKEKKRQERLRRKKEKDKLKTEITQEDRKRGWMGLVAMGVVVVAAVIFIFSRV